MGNHHGSLSFMGQCVKLLRYGLRSSRGLVVDSCDPGLYSGSVFRIPFLSCLRAIILLNDRLSIKPSTQMLIEYGAQLDIKSVLYDPAFIQRCVA